MKLLSYLFSPHTNLGRQTCLLILQDVKVQARLTRRPISDPLTASFVLVLFYVESEQKWEAGSYEMHRKDQRLGYTMSRTDDLIGNGSMVSKNRLSNLEWMQAVHSSGLLYRV